ncbi:CsgE family curli-type amyloid fiber assembly protein [Aureisphaera galaxeae]|uniref:CsgE family curli-type amyloid fiber assembly protein n=1 Tax=Aureisphaera galaxeae TaxID=1538023 RepID=UPI002350B105|nr:CsgE family curli-type amyloid fiber assembly protein [Aureisphaera galaxeae]MDC8006196.1 CsgE family curli-type amyloid fiber assembly protein [Aureisphaera galaxeae]
MDRAAILIALLCFSLFSAGCHAQIYNAEIEAKIDIVSNGEFYDVTGFAINKTDGDKSLRYVLSIFKNDSIGNNLSKDEKADRVVLRSGEKKRLPTLNVNAKLQTRTIALLLIYDKDDRILGKDRIIMNEIKDTEVENKIVEQNNSISDDKVYSGADGVVLKGIVVENTKTKPGRDFYRDYAQQYNLNQIEGEEVVVVNEVFGLGTSTKIQVQVGDAIIFQFFVNPRADFLDQMVQSAIWRTNTYFNQLRKSRSLVKKY